MSGRPLPPPIEALNPFLAAQAQSFMLVDLHVCELDVQEIRPDATRAGLGCLSDLQKAA